MIDRTISHETRVTAVASMHQLREDVQKSLTRQASKVFFRNELEMAACVRIIGRLDRAIEELSS